MKKMMTVLFVLMPFVSMADMNLDLHNQMLDSEIEKYTKIRDEKYEALKQCEKTTTGFKIAGITTLIATGVGVYGNIKLAQKANGKTSSSGNGTDLGKSTKSPQQKASDQCMAFCVKAPVLAKKYNCNC